MVQRFLTGNLTIILFYYDGNVDGWWGLNWSSKAIHIVAQKPNKVGSSKSGGENTDSGSGVNTLSSSKTEPQFETESPISKKASSSDHQAFDQHHLQLQQQQRQHQLQQEMASDASKTGPSQNQSAA